MRPRDTSDIVADWFFLYTFQAQGCAARHMLCTRVVATTDEGAPFCASRTAARPIQKKPNNSLVCFFVGNDFVPARFIDYGDRSRWNSLYAGKHTIRLHSKHTSTAHDSATLQLHSQR